MILSAFRAAKPIPLILSLGGFLLMMSLGGWQLQRLAWKENLLAEIQTARDSKPLDVLPQEGLESLSFHTVKLIGTFLHEKSFHVAARYYKSKLGYHIFTPFMLEDGRIVVVNRGWVPVKQKELSTRPDSEPKGEQELVGMIRVGSDRSRFTPPNQPDKNIWFGRDVDQMAAQSGLTLLPITIDIMAEENPDGHLPIASGGQISLRNDHLQYAITWFLVGLGIAVIFIVYHRPKKS